MIEQEPNPISAALDAPADVDNYAARLRMCQRNALLAARAATDANAELLRFQHEGPACNWPFGDLEPVSQLAEATMHAARIEAAMLAEQPSAADYRSSLGQLAAACFKFLSDQSQTPLIDEIPESEVPF